MIRLGWGRGVLLRRRRSSPAQARRSLAQTRSSPAQPRRRIRPACLRLRRRTRPSRWARTHSSRVRILQSSRGSTPQQGQYPQQGEYGQQGQYPQQQGQYLQQGQYSRQAPAPYGGYGRQAAPYPVQRGQYAQQPYVPGVSPAQQNGSGPVTLSPGLLLNVRTSEPLSTGRLKTGELVQFTSASDLYANGIVAIPRGAVLTGEVVEAKNAGAFGGSPKLDLKLTSLMLGGRSYSLDSDVWSSQGPSKTGYTATNTIGGAAFGAIIGAIAGGGIGAGVGAVAGGAGGALVSGANARASARSACGSAAAVFT